MIKDRSHVGNGGIKAVFVTKRYEYYVGRAASVNKLSGNANKHVALYVRLILSTQKPKSIFCLKKVLSLL